MSEILTITLVYLGLHASEGKNGGMQAYHMYAEPDKIEPFLFGKQSACRIFKKQLVACSVGSELECQVKVEGEGMTVVGKPKWIGRWSNKDLIKTMEARSETTAIIIEEHKLERSEMNLSELRVALEPVRSTYQLLHNAKKRAALLAWIMQFLAE